MRSSFRTLSIASSNRSRASLRFTACDRESWTVTLMPVGRCRSVTAVETLFTFWPPGPLDRAKLSSRSVSFISSFRIRSAKASCDILHHSTTPSLCEKFFIVRFLLTIQRFTFSNELPMAGLEPARANYGPTDFKSVASTIPPHRRFGVNSKLLLKRTKMDFTMRTDSDRARKSACLGFGDCLKERQSA